MSVLLSLFGCGMKNRAERDHGEPTIEGSHKLHGFLSTRTERRGRGRVERGRSKRESKRASKHGAIVPYPHQALFGFGRFVCRVVALFRCYLFFFCGAVRVCVYGVDAGHQAWELGVGFVECPPQRPNECESSLRSRPVSTARTDVLAVIGLRDSPCFCFSLLWSCLTP